MHQIKLLSSAQKDLDSFPLKLFNRIRSEIIKLSTNAHPHGSLKLTAEEGYRLRVGDYRILYRINANEKIIYIYRIKHRKEVYR